MQQKRRIERVRVVALYLDPATMHRKAHSYPRERCARALAIFPGSSVI